MQNEKKVQLIYSEINAYKMTTFTKRVPKQRKSI